MGFEKKITSSMCARIALLLSTLVAYNEAYNVHSQERSFLQRHNVQNEDIEEVAARQPATHGSQKSISKFAKVIRKRKHFKQHAIQLDVVQNDTDQNNSVQNGTDKASLPARAAPSPSVSPAPAPYAAAPSPKAAEAPSPVAMSAASPLGFDDANVVKLQQFGDAACTPGTLKATVRFEPGADLSKCSEMIGLGHAKMTCNASVATMTFFSDSQCSIRMLSNEGDHINSLAIQSNETLQPFECYMATDLFGNQSYWQFNGHLVTPMCKEATTTSTPTTSTHLGDTLNKAVTDVLNSPAEVAEQATNIVKKSFNSPAEAAEQATNIAKRVFTPKGGVADTVIENVFGKGAAEAMQNSTPIVPIPDTSEATDNATAPVEIPAGSLCGPDPGVVKYGPKQCISLWKSGEGHCVIATHCAEADIADYTFGLICVDDTCSPEKHIFTSPGEHLGELPYHPKEAFDTLISCHQCLGLENVPPNIAMAGDMATMSKDIAEIKDVVKMHDRRGNPEAPPGLSASEQSDEIPAVQFHFKQKKAEAVAGDPELAERLKAWHVKVEELKARHVTYLR
jgi:hypothetical protein